MQKYKTFRAMLHKMRLRSQYFYGRKHVDSMPTFWITSKEYYEFEKDDCVKRHRTCQSAYFTYEISEPVR